MALNPNPSLVFSVTLQHEAGAVLSVCLLVGATAETIDIGTQLTLTMADGEVVV